MNYNINGNLALKSEKLENKFTFKEIKKSVKSKIIEDLVRFRTCCADPRASK